MGGSGLDAGLTGSTTGLPSGCFAVRVPLMRVFAFFGCGAVDELPVLDAVDPAFVDPDVPDPELCACIAIGAISATAIKGSTTLLWKFIGGMPSCSGE
jgi:hypothetical protein